MNEELESVRSNLQGQIAKLNGRMDEMENRTCDMRNDSLVQELRDEIEVWRKKVERLEVSIELRNRERALLRRQMEAIRKALVWSNCNGGMAYVLQGVGYIGIDDFLENVK